MSNNRPSDLVAAMMEQVHRLNDPKLKGDDLRDEIARSKAMADLGRTVTETHDLGIRAFKVGTDAGLRPDRIAPLLIGQQPKPEDAAANGK